MSDRREYMKQWLAERETKDPGYKQRQLDRLSTFGKRYKATEEYRAKQRAKRSSDSYKAQRRAYRKLQHVRSKERDYERRKLQEPAHRQRVLERSRARRQRPAVKERLRQMDKARWDSGEKKYYMRIYNWQRGLGFTLDQYHAMRESQGEVCKICGTYTPDLRVDHNHATGKVRGLLCGTCNSGLGFLKDSPVVLRSAVQYLERANG